MGRGYTWLDTGTHSSLLNAGNFVRTLAKRQGMQSGSPGETAYSNGWISPVRLRLRAEEFKKKDYGQYLAQVAEEKLQRPVE